MNICVDPAGIPGTFIGEPPIDIGEGQEIYCSDCHTFHHFEICPWCGAWIHYGYGCTPFGFGSYMVCLQGCGWWYVRVAPLDAA